MNNIDKAIVGKDTCYVSKYLNELNRILHNHKEFGSSRFRYAWGEKVRVLAKI